MQVISRKNAMAAGLSLYFTGKPCVNGMVSPRRVPGFACTCEKCKASRCVYAKGNYAEKSEQIISRVRRWQADNPERHRSSMARYRAENDEYFKRKRREWYENNRDHALAYARDCDLKAPEVRLAYNAARNHAQRDRVPAWFSELDDFCVKECIRLCRDRLAATGQKWHVDHMIPLRSKTASGLHVFSNLQVIPAFLNGWKKNKMVLTDHDDWLLHL